MSFNKEGEAQFPVGKKEVFEAVKKAVINVGFKLDSADEFMGRINAKAGMSLMSWGENVPIQVSSISENETKVSLSSGSKVGWGGSQIDFGKNASNIEKILSETSKILQNE